MKQLFKFLKPFLVAIGLILIFESIVFPGLSAASTITNMLALMAGLIAGYFAYNYYKQCFFKPTSDIELTEQEQADIIEYIKSKGVYQETKPKAKRKPKEVIGEGMFQESTTIAVYKPKRKPRTKKKENE